MKKIYVMLWFMTCFLILFAVSGFSADIDFYVSQSGKDTNPGTKSKPFATLEKAREAVRNVIQTANSNGAVSVIIRKGDYTIKDTFLLEAKDSGLEKSPVIWKAYPGETVNFIGGVSPEKFSKIKDSSVLNRLDKSARDKIVSADLTKFSLTDYGDIDPKSGKRLEVYFKGKFMDLARYPNEGWLKIADVPQTGNLEFEGVTPHKRDGIFVGRHYGRFTYDGDRPSGWASTKDVWMQGFWTWDWADAYQLADRIDTATKEIYPAKPYHHYGYHKNQRYYFLNVLEELDMPGEWYIDRAAGILYFYPPEKIKSGDVFVSVLEKPMIVMDGASNVTIAGINFKVSRGDAIQMKDGENNLIAGCTFTNFGKYPVSISGGKNNGITGCDIFETASGGIRLSGGDRKTLTPAGNFATNNHIWNYAKRLKTYQSALTMSGVGNRLANNLIHGAPHMAIGWSGNDNIIELNEVYDVLLETNDAGAIYNGRDPSHQGNIIRYNYLHNIGKEKGHGTNAVYFDDALCGNTVFGNVFYKAGVPGAAKMGAMFIHGGRYITVDNNIFIECAQAFNESPWSDETWKNYYVVHGWQKRLYEDVDISKPPYTDRYPWLQNIKTDERPNILSRNLVYKCGAFLDRGKQELIDNWETSEDPGFVNAAKQNFMLRDDAAVYQKIPGFKKIPFDKIGIYKDEYRK